MPRPSSVTAKWEDIDPGDTMTNGERAKIFAPYAALKGFGDYIYEQEQEIAERVVLSEDAQEDLNWRLQQLRIGDTATVTYYLNRRYVDATGAVRKINMDERYIRIGGIDIPLKDILSVE